MLFKVPSLRNVDMTGPYFHNGKVAFLKEAVRQMSEYQRGRSIWSLDGIPDGSGTTPGKDLIL